MNSSNFFITKLNKQSLYGLLTPLLSFGTRPSVKNSKMIAQVIAERDITIENCLRHQLRQKREEEGYYNSFNMPYSSDAAAAAVAVSLEGHHQPQPEEEGDHTTYTEYVPPQSR